MKKVSPEEAAEELQKGEVALAPTETVVGLVASEAEINRIFEIKGRDPGKSIALLCRSSEEAFGLASEVPPLARKLAEEFWPGPLTLVLDAPDGGTVGVRVPDHSVIQRLLDAFGKPLYATSANLSGGEAPASLGEVHPGVSEAVDVVVEGEPGGGEASSVVDLSGGQVRLLRPGAGLDEERLVRMRRG